MSDASCQRAERNPGYKATPIGGERLCYHSLDFIRTATRVTNGLTSDEIADFRLLRIQCMELPNVELGRSLVSIARSITVHFDSVSSGSAQRQLPGEIKFSSAHMQNRGMRTEQSGSYSLSIRKFSLHLCRRLRTPDRREAVDDALQADIDNRSLILEVAFPAILSVSIWSGSRVSHRLL